MSTSLPWHEGLSGLAGDELRVHDCPYRTKEGSIDTANYDDRGFYGVVTQAGHGRNISTTLAGTNSAGAPSEEELDRIAEASVQRLPQILLEVRDLLEHQQPEYAQFLDEQFDSVIEAGAGFLRELVMRASRRRDAGERPRGPEQQLVEEVGRAHFRHGQSLMALLAAYRTGATVAWDHVAAAALQTGVAAQGLVDLGSTVFAAVDQLSEATVRGYVQQQQVSGQERSRRREELTELLLSDRATVGAVRAAAARAEWPLPEQAAVVLIEAPSSEQQERVRGLGAGCLQLWRDDRLVAVVPDATGPGQQQRLATALAGSKAAVGPNVGLPELPRSLRLAEAAIQLRGRGLLAGDPVFAAQHLDTIIVHRDEQLLVQLRQQYLAELDALSSPARERLLDTLTCWLRHMGDRRLMAAALHVHPHTVRYRMRQLEELLGPQLYTPEVWAKLMLILGWGEPDASAGENGTAEGGG